MCKRTIDEGLKIKVSLCEKKSLQLVKQYYSFVYESVKVIFKGKTGTYIKILHINRKKG